MNKTKGLIALIVIASALLLTNDTFSYIRRGWGGRGWGWGGGYGFGLGFGLGYGTPYYGIGYGYPYWGGYGIGYGLGYGIAADRYARDRRERERYENDRAYRMGRQDERDQQNRLNNNRTRE
jgi:hypothetical protein